MANCLNPEPLAVVCLPDAAVRLGCSSSRCEIGNLESFSNSDHILTFGPRGRGEMRCVAVAWRCVTTNLLQAVPKKDGRLMATRRRPMKGEPYAIRRAEPGAEVSRRGEFTFQFCGLHNWRVHPNCTVHYWIFCSGDLIPVIRVHYLFIEITEADWAVGRKVKATMFRTLWEMRMRYDQVRNGSSGHLIGQLVVRQCNYPEVGYDVTTNARFPINYPHL